VTGGARRLGRRIPTIGVAFAASLALAACSAAPTAAPSARPVVAGPTPTITTYALDAKGWIDGFIVKFLSATASLDPKGGTLTVLATIENTGADDAALDAPIVLTAGDATFQLTHGTELPDLPAGDIAAVSLPFDVVGRGSVDDAVIRVGRAGDHVVAVPLLPAGGALVSLEPIELDVAGTGRTGSLKVTLHHVELRWDLPDWHDELPSATQALTITYDATYTGTFSGGFPFTGDNVRLRLPDGSTFLLARQDGHSQSIARIDAGKTAKALSSRFEIQDGLTGAFALFIDDGSSTKAIPFTIKP
jgi:hypothetical protein